jgi:serine/threonine-protein kinase
VAALVAGARQRRPDDFWLSEDLGLLLLSSQPPRYEEAIRFLTAAVAIRRRSPQARANLGRALQGKGLLDEAIAEYREALRLKNHVNGQVRNNLAAALLDKGLLDEAITEYRETIRLDEFKNSTSMSAIAAHYKLGNILRSNGRLDEAISEYREILRRLPEPQAHCALGLALVETGQFPEGVKELRRGHELGSRQPDWRYPSAEWLRNAERLKDLESRLPDLLHGKATPADAGEMLALAQFCQLHKNLHYAAAVRWFREAFATQPALVQDLSAGHRYNAACAAALAGCGKGEDAKALGQQERARLRRQALDWLRSDLKAYGQMVEKNADKVGPQIAQQMQHWLQDTDFAGVRGSEALGRLPEAERPGWQKLWEEVEALRRRAMEPARRSHFRPGGG